MSRVPPIMRPDYPGSIVHLGHNMSAQPVYGIVVGMAVYGDSVVRFDMYRGGVGQLTVSWTGGTYSADNTAWRCK